VASKVPSRMLTISKLWDLWCQCQCGLLCHLANDNAFASGVQNLYKTCNYCIAEFYCRVQQQYQKNFLHCSCTALLWM